ncbi:Hypothetical predicted protein [Podarcis lilfordi]|uniref:Uncharacterized protein n=1 Tax=Podarcis lilfordi TaxID=74358 RepID=A0AA35P3P3_9SAUR|nr:Hypothetical predicted protein [Podarcis lilfordi]
MHHIGEPNAFASAQGAEAASRRQLAPSARARYGYKCRYGEGASNLRALRLDPERGGREERAGRGGADGNLRQVCSEIGRKEPLRRALGRRKKRDSSSYCAFDGCKELVVASAGGVLAAEQPGGENPARDLEGKVVNLFQEETSERG